MDRCLRDTLFFIILLLYRNSNNTTFFLWEITPPGAYKGNDTMIESDRMLFDFGGTIE